MRKTVIACGLLSAAMLLTSCTGPYGGKEDEVREILIPLLEKDIELTSYIWGDAFTTLEDPSDHLQDTASHYMRVNEDAPYHSVEEFKADIEGLYTAELTEVICAYAFENTDDVMSRFCDYTGYLDVEKTQEFTDLQIDVTTNHPAYKITAVGDLSTLKVTRSTSSIIECEIEYTMGSRTDVMSIRLILEDDVWQIDSQNWLAAYIN